MSEPTRDDVWPQRDLFRRLVNECMQAGHMPIDIAEACGMSESTLRAYRSDRTRHPKKETIIKAADFFTRILKRPFTIADFVGGSASAPEIPGVAAEQVHGLSETKKLVAKLMFQEIQSDDLSDAEALAVLEAFRGIKNALKLAKG